MSAPFTLQMLTDARACKPQVDEFRNAFGESVNVTVARAKRVAGKFDWHFGRRFLDDEGKAAYRAATAEPRAAYDAAKAEAWALAYIATCKRRKVPA